MLFNSNNMKKFFALLLPGLFIFSGCSFGDLFVDQVAIHNTLVQKMDRVLVTEEDFFNEYIILADGDDVQPVADAYEQFKVSAQDLDAYFADTTFAESQQLFKDEYYEYYKPFVDEYLTFAGDFVEDVKANGFVYDAMGDHFERVDKKAEEFVDIHNRLIDTINTQADTVVTGQEYTY